MEIYGRSPFLGRRCIVGMFLFFSILDAALLAHMLTAPMKPTITSTTCRPTGLAMGSLQQ
jgi:hypothetical protein